MSFKQNLAVFAVMFVVSTVAMTVALPWATPGMILDVLGLLIEYPVILFLLGGFVVAGLVGDYLG
jgi:hypothetical protein